MSEIGTVQWWICAPFRGPRGIMDCVLRLLEQGEISRAKACELVLFGLDGGAAYRIPVPSAPWERLNWGEPEEAA